MGTRTLGRILYIDDDEHLAEIAKLALEEVGGYTVMTCSNGFDGIRAASEWRPDLILLDVMMPKIDGPSTLGRLKQIAGVAEIPVILLNWRRWRSDPDEYRLLGAAGAIIKPFHPLSLAARVNELWQGLPTVEPVADALRLLCAEDAERAVEGCTLVGAK